MPLMGQNKFGCKYETGLMHTEFNSVDTVTQIHKRDDFASEEGDFEQVTAKSEWLPKLWKACILIWDRTA